MVLDLYGSDSVLVSWADDPEPPAEDPPTEDSYIPEPDLEIVPVAVP